MKINFKKWWGWTTAIGVKSVSFLSGVQGWHEQPCAERARFQVAAVGESAHHLYLDNSLVCSLRCGCSPCDSMHMSWVPQANCTWLWALLCGTTHSRVTPEYWCLKSILYFFQHTVPSHTITTGTRGKNGQRVLENTLIVSKSIYIFLKCPLPSQLITGWLSQGAFLLTDLIM